MKYLLSALLLALAATTALAQPALSGRTLDGKAFDLAERRGRVVLLLLWRTDCAVCLNKMPELRANAAGWRDKPFDLVTLNLDPAKADADAYERARQQTGAARHPQVAVPQAPDRLPVLLLFDTDGKLVKRHEGRVPPEAWDEVAERLP
jgi:thiol-disulfide isomerase/thioredoxin